MTLGGMLAVSGVAGAQTASAQEHELTVNNESSHN
jgi:hypothetical protein